MKFKKNFSFFLTFLLTSCGTQTNNTNINSINSNATNSTNSKVTKFSPIDNDSTSDGFENMTDVYSQDFQDDEDNGNYSFRDQFSKIIIDEDSEYIEIPIYLMFLKKLKTYDKYISIQYTFINIHEGRYHYSDTNPIENVTPVKQGTPVFIQKQTDDFFEKHYANTTNENYIGNYTRFLFTIQIPTQKFLDTYKEKKYHEVCLSFCEFAEADGYTYSNGVKDEYIKNYYYNKEFVNIEFSEDKYTIYHDQY